jgi:transposase
MVIQDSVRNQSWRLGILRHVEEVTHNVAKTCRYFGISRTAYYRWLERYQKYGEEGLLDRSRRPKHSPRVTKPVIIAKIIYLRHIILDIGKLWSTSSGTMISMSAALASGGS